MARARVEKNDEFDYNSAWQKGDIDSYAETWNESITALRAHLQVGVQQRAGDGPRQSVKKQEGKTCYVCGQHITDGYRADYRGYRHWGKCVDEHGHPITPKPVGNAQYRMTFRQRLAEKTR